MIVLMAVMARAAQQIQSVTHHSVIARTIRCRLQQSGMSARYPLHRLLLTVNHRHLCHKWCDERRAWASEWNDIVFTGYCDGRIRVWRHRGERLLICSVMHRHTGSSPGIMVWGGIIFHCRTPLLQFAGTLNSQHYSSEVLELVVLLYI
ncbi:transposable element Tcb1 transposase [Trichonephila clavipes]|nr:transposable element Tcb1 transposase [Trichonephila clavipes]